MALSPVPTNYREAVKTPPRSHQKADPNREGEQWP